MLRLGQISVNQSLDQGYRFLEVELKDMAGEIINIFFLQQNKGKTDTFLFYSLDIHSDNQNHSSYLIEEITQGLSRIELALNKTPIHFVLE